MRHGRLISTFTGFAIATILGLLLPGQPVSAFDITDVQPAALDQPRVNALLRRTPTGGPLTGTDIIFGDEIFNIQVFYDTGASGIILSDLTADFLGVTRARFPEPSGPLVVFEDVGVGGSALFNVSEPLYFGLAPFHPFADINNPATESTVYDQAFGPLRAQVGGSANPLLAGIDVFGMPVMQGKAVVMDPKPLNTLLDTMRTYVYDPGTPFDPAQADTNPGIPSTNRHIELNYASFDRFTQTTPAGADGPDLRYNPFIGPNPVAAIDPGIPPGNTPGITIALAGNQATGSFLFDTGAAGSIVSTNLAAAINVRYRPGTFGTADPLLELFDPADPSAPGTLLPNQFQLTLSGIGGSVKAAGFFLDSLSVPTIEGDPLNYIGAPVLVFDISVQDPITLDTLTLDGVFGMNFLVASIFFIEDPLTFGPTTVGPFDWLVFDEPTGLLGLQLAGAPPVPTVPTITNPTPATTLTGSDVTFTWNANGSAVDQYQLIVGSSVGGNDLFDSQPLPGTQLSVAVTGLPTDGGPLFVRFSYMIAGVWAFTDVIYTAFDSPAVPELTSPVPGTILPGADVTFQWADNGNAVDAWWVLIGSEPGGFDLFNSQALPAGTSALDVTGLPTDGRTIHAELFFHISGVWDSVKVQYTAADFPNPEITNPTPGSTLLSSDALFEWNDNNNAVAAWWLLVGSTPGGYDLFNSGQLPAGTLSLNVTGLPTDGRPCHVRLFFHTGEEWKSDDFQYTCATIPDPAITNPASNSTFTGTDVTFNWTDNGNTVEAWWVLIGSTPGGFDLFNSQQLPAGTLSLDVTGLPTDGRTVFVRFFYLIGGVWTFTDVSYTAATLPNPEITSPLPSSTLPGPDVTFDWTDNGHPVAAWWVLIGSTQGGFDLFNSQQLPAGTRAVTVTGLPTDGRTLHVRLFFNVGGVWQSADFQYTAGSGL